MRRSCRHRAASTIVDDDAGSDVSVAKTAAETLAEREYDSGCDEGMRWLRRGSTSAASEEARAAIHDVPQCGARPTWTDAPATVRKSVRVDATELGHKGRAGDGTQPLVAADDRRETGRHDGADARRIDESDVQKTSPPSRRLSSEVALGELLST